VEEWLTEAQAWLKSRRARNLPAYLLRQPGFTVKLLSARVFGAGQLGPEYDHMLLLVEMHERWIADVGFGDSFLQPLRLDDPAQQAQEQGGCAYRLLATEAQMVLQQSKEGVWNSQYAFALEPRQLAEFDAMCDYQQTSPASNFTQQSSPDSEHRRATGRTGDSRCRVISSSTQILFRYRARRRGAHRALDGPPGYAS